MEEYMVKNFAFYEILAKKIFGVNMPTEMDMKEFEDFIEKFLPMIHQIQYLSKRENYHYIYANL